MNKTIFTAFIFAMVMIGSYLSAAPWQPGRRPFSWYYPNTYQYYYPTHRHDSCNWMYTNGSYVYYCH